ncbi:MAG TPA: ANTAR domain-containing protein [Candidatus Limnocylindrales bacterium]|nr:ANTAR domain-containing protein [Candidatus Limnocylindrales bacterium]
MRRVLVIDDHESSRRDLVNILLQRGYEIVGEGSSGKLALTLARTATPDVMLMAVGLADLDGIQAASEILATYHLPIVLITSHYDAMTVERATKAGVMALLLKPVRADAVSPAIELAISRFKDFLALQQENESLKENLESRKIIERAKGLLMEQRRLSEEQAYSLIKKTSMNMRKPMADVAQAILLAAEIDQQNK